MASSWKMTSPLHHESTTDESANRHEGRPSLASSLGGVYAWNWMCEGDSFASLPAGEWFSCSSISRFSCPKLVYSLLTEEGSRHGRRQVHLSALSHYARGSRAGGAGARPYRTFHLPIGPGTEGALYTAALSPDGKRLAVSGMPLGRGALGMLIYLLALDTGKIETVLKGHKEPVVSLAWSPDGSRVASASLDATARIYDVGSGQTEHTLEGHRGSVKAVAFSPDGRRIVTGSEDRTARVWSADTGQVETELRGHTNSVESVAWHPDGETVATGSVDATIRLWGLARRADRRRADV